MKWIVTMLALIASQAHAIERCQEHAAMAAELARDYSEAMVFGGAIRNGDVISVWVGQGDDQTWTLLHTHQNGVSCIITSGLNGEVIVPVLIEGNPT